MDNNQILKKAIKKAESKGWASPTSDSVEWFNFECIIFGHDFAKCFFGENEIDSSDLQFNDEYNVSHWIQNHTPKYIYHLQKMVLDENPLKYLERFL